MSHLALHFAHRYRVAKAVAEDEFSLRIERLLEIDEAVRRSGEAVRKSADLLYEEILPGLPLYALLYEHGRTALSRDIVQLLALKLDQAVEIDELAVADADYVGALGPHPSPNPATDINSVYDWLNVLKDSASTFDGNLYEFFELLKRAFPNLVFSSSFPECLDSFFGKYYPYRGVVSDAFSKLSNTLRNCLEKRTIKEALAAFTAASGYETSMEGNAARHDVLTFNFVDDDNKSVKVLCEPHMKLSKSDVSGDNTYYQHRIYFCPSERPGFGRRILVGHAGRHL